MHTVVKLPCRVSCPTAMLFASIEGIQGRLKIMLIINICESSDVASNQSGAPRRSGHCSLAQGDSCVILVWSLQIPSNGDSKAEANQLAGPRVSHLPPMYLSLSFPSDYPSAAMPDAQLSALWLTADSAQLLEDHLAELWDEQVRVHILCQKSTCRAPRNLQSRRDGQAAPCCIGPHECKTALNMM